MKTYSELSRLETFEERFEYLKLKGSVGMDTFGFDRYLNQAFYNSYEWKRARNAVIARDLGCDLGVEGHDIYGKVIIHHMNPITEQDIIDRNPDIYNPEYLVCVSPLTHNAIHYSDINLLPKGPVVRSANDTCPWKNRLGPTDNTRSAQH